MAVNVAFAAEHEEFVVYVTCASPEALVEAEVELKFPSEFDAGENVTNTFCNGVPLLFVTVAVKTDVALQATGLVPADNVRTADGVDVGPGVGVLGGVAVGVTVAVGATVTVGVGVAPEVTIT